MSDFLKNNKFNFYYVDTHLFTRMATSRIIITMGCPKALEGFQRVENRTLDNIFQIVDGRLFYATTFTDQSGTSYKHTVHLMLDCKTLDTKDLYSKSMKMAVDHSLANTKVWGNRFKPCACLIYNGIGKTCKSPYTQEQTQEIMFQQTQEKLHSRDVIRSAIFRPRQLDRNARKRPIPNSGLEGTNSKNEKRRRNRRST